MGAPAPLRPNDPRASGPYQLLARLGAGGMGEVYLGRDEAGQLAAVKLVHDVYATDPRFRARFAREIEIARSVPSPWAAVVLDADPHGDPPWLATQYIPGPSLEAAVAATGALPEPTTEILTATLARALAVVHAAGVVHRDVKPSNVLLGDDGPRLIDFGIARALDATAITQTGMILGAPGYLSPEQALGEEAGPPADVFSLACVLTYAGSGRPPFGQAENPLALIRRIVDEPADLTDLPRSLHQVVEPCLSKDPSGRPSAAQLAQQLHATPGPAPGWLPQPVAELIPHRRARGHRRLSRRTLLAGAAAASVTGIGVAALRARPDPTPTPPRRTPRWTFQADTSVRQLTRAADLVIADSDDQVYALDSDTGQLRWSSLIPSSGGNSHSRSTDARKSACVGDAYYSDDGRGIVALDTTSGRRRWEQDGAQLVAACASMVIGIAIGDREDPDLPLIGLDPATGALRWTHRPTGYLLTTHTGSPGGFMAAVDDEWLHVVYRDRLCTHDSLTGSLAWQQPRLGSLDLLTTDPHPLLVATPADIRRLDPDSGSPRWVHPVEVSTWFRAVPHEDVVVLSHPYQLAVLDADTGHLRWQRPTAPTGHPARGPRSGTDEPRTHYLSQPAVLTGAVHSGEVRDDTRFVVVARELANGADRWELPLDIRLRGSSSTLSSPDSITRFIGTWSAVYLAVDNTVYAIDCP